MSMQDALNAMTDLVAAARAIQEYAADEDVPTAAARADATASALDAIRTQLVDVAGADAEADAWSAVDAGRTSVVNLKRSLALSRRGAAATLEDLAPTPSAVRRRDANGRPAVLYLANRRGGIRAGEVRTIQ